MWPLTSHPYYIIYILLYTATEICINRCWCSLINKSRWPLASFSFRPFVLPFSAFLPQYQVGCLARGDTSDSHFFIWSPPQYSLMYKTNRILFISFHSFDSYLQILPACRFIWFCSMPCWPWKMLNLTRWQDMQLYHYVLRHYVLSLSCPSAEWSERSSLIHWSKFGGVMMCKSGNNSSGIKFISVFGIKCKSPRFPFDFSFFASLQHQYPRMESEYVYISIYLDRNLLTAVVELWMSHHLSSLTYVWRVNDML